MSKELLKLALKDPELARKKIAWARKKAAMEKPFKSEYSLTKKASLSHAAGGASSIAKSLLSTAGSGLGAASTFKLLSALRPDLAEFAVVGGVGAGGVLGHDVAKHLANKLRPELAESALVGGVGADGVLGHDVAMHLANKAKVASWANKKASVGKPFKSGYSLVKEAILSRAAKGAIGLPAAALLLGPIAAATHMPYVADDMLKQLDPLGKLDEVSGILKTLYGPLKVPAAMGIEGGQILSGEIMGRAGASLAGLSALGAGAGKLSERFIPVAKKSIMDNPTARKAALAAALFPWSLAIGGGAYLLGKNNSDR